MKKVFLIYLLFYSFSCNVEKDCEKKESIPLEELISSSKNEILELQEINESQLRLNESIIALGFNDSSIHIVWSIDNYSKNLIQLIKNGKFESDIEDKINEILLDFDIKPLNYDGNKYDGQQKDYYNLTYIKSLYIKITKYFIANHKELLKKNRLTLVVQD